MLKSQLFEKLEMRDDAFLAAQGVLNKDMEKNQKMMLKKKQVFCISPIL